MAKDVKFNIKLSIDGKEHVVTAYADVKRLAQGMGEAQTGAAGLRDSLLDINLSTQAFQNAFSGLQQITGLMQQYTAATAVQQEAEAKLANNMRNTMGAREEDIQSIKDLLSAQQESGVIGDEIQMNGAQELTTYLEKRSSLEKLIPVMNDMIAQQYGLNATSEAAVNIATMLGKVMNGQTGALSRYGYSFDEAQEQILKFGTESERAAVLADVVSESVGGMNAELAKTDAGKAKQAADAFGDLQEEIGAVFAGIEPLVIQVGQLGLAVNGFVTVSTGVAGVSKAVAHLAGATNIAKASMLAQAGAGKVAAAVQALWNMQLRYGRQANIAWAFSAKLATVQALAMRAAILGLMAVSGVGLAFAAVSAIISLFSDGVDKSTESMKKSNAEAKKAEAEAERIKQVQEAEAQAYTNASAKIGIFTQRLEELLRQKKTGKNVSSEEKKIIGELNDAYGGTMGYFSNVSGWYKALTANSKAYCRQMVLEARIRTLANQIAEKEAETHGIIYDGKGKKKKYSTRRERESVSVQSSTTGTSFSVLGAEIAGSSDLEKAQKRLGGLRAETEELKRQMRDAVKESAGLSFSVTGGKKRDDGTEPGKPAKDKTRHLIENANTYEELTNNVAYYNQELEKCDIKDTERILTLARHKKAAEEAVEAFNKVVESVGDKPAEDTLEYYNEKIRELRDALKTASQEEAVSINEQIARWEEKAEAIRNAKAEAAGSERLREIYGEKKEEAENVRKDYEIGIIGKDEAIQAINEINAALEALGLKPVDVKIDTGDVEKATEEIAGSVGEIGQSLSSVGQNLEIPALNVAGMIAQAVATLALGYAEATEKAAKMGPIAWVAFAASGLAQLAAVVSSVKGMAAFADGGIVSGPTLALVGEYGGASRNPEVIAPLDKLRSLIGHDEEEIPRELRFRLAGEDLVAVYDRRKNKIRRV